MKFKKLASLFLACAMVAGMNASAFADKFEINKNISSSGVEVSDYNLSSHGITMVGDDLIITQKDLGYLFNMIKGNPSFIDEYKFRERKTLLVRLTQEEAMLLLLAAGDDEDRATSLEHLKNTTFTIEYRNGTYITSSLNNT